MIMTIYMLVGAIILAILLCSDEVRTAAHRNLNSAGMLLFVIYVIMAWPVIVMGALTGLAVGKGQVVEDANQVK